MKMKRIIKKYRGIFVYASMLFFICFCIALKQSAMSGTDLFIHNHEFLNLSNTTQVELSYPLYHLVVLMVYIFGKLLFPVRMSVDIASAIVMGVIEVCVYYLACKMLMRYSVKEPEVIACILCLVTAIWCPFYNINIYLGQGSPNTWHSPTNMIVKPFAILIFFMVVDLLSKIKQNEKLRIKECIILTFSLVLSALAKPSFYQGFIPALFLYIMVTLFTRFNLFKQYFVLGLCIIPSTLLILFQMFSSFFLGEGSSSEGIGIGWFLVPKLYAHSILFSLFLLLCFPLCFSILHKEKLKRLDLKLAWIYFVISYLEYGFLYEKGERFAHGNFGWAYSLATFILFIITTGLFFEEFNINKMKDKILLGIWILHGISGIFYVLILIFVPKIWY